MIDEIRTSQYLLLIRNMSWEKTLSPAQLQEIMGRWAVWYENIQKSGKLVGAQPLLAEGKIVSGKNGKSVADGPFAESKEAIAGYFLVDVESIDEAIAFAKANPLLEYGIAIEVRPVAAQCPVLYELENAPANATA